MIHSTVSVGRYVRIDGKVTIGRHTMIGNFVTIRAGVKIGENNRIHDGALIGTDPQDYHYRGEKSYCIIGDDNSIREYATISRATGRDEETSIGDGNMIMTYVHVAHNVRIGSHTIVASGVQLGGHVEVGDYANIGGLSGVHQFCRIGRYAMLGAKSYLNKDLIPGALAQGNRARVFGVNTRGLRQRGFSWREIDEIKEIFRFIYRSPVRFRDLPGNLQRQFPAKFAREISAFVKHTTRGLAAHS